MVGLAAVYAGARRLERLLRIPGWLRLALLGSTRQPMYLLSRDPAGVDASDLLHVFLRHGRPRVS